jgi:hypothetical protein
LEYFILPIAEDPALTLSVAVRFAPDTVPVVVEILPVAVRFAPDTVPVAVEILPVAQRFAPDTVPEEESDVTDTGALSDISVNERDINTLLA